MGTLIGRLMDARDVRAARGVIMVINRGRIAEVNQFMLRLMYRKTRFSNLCESSIDEQLDPCDVAAVFRCEEYDGFGDVVGSSKSPERNAGQEHFPCFRAR